MIDTDHIQEVLEQFDWSSAIDVFLIAVAVFATFRLLSNTRAMTALRGGVLLILFAVLLGRLFNLTVVNFVVENGISVVLIGAAVVFQPELRRALDRLGRTGLREFLQNAPDTAVLDAVTAAAGQLARERHGGLIVLERATGLQDVIDTGVAVDATISPELLTGIFFPNSPLHDMAVVIRNDRVVAASCELPLAHELPPGSRGLGTRHRAAIGITEETDAVTIVVSEETGGISVARRGRLTHVKDEARLRQSLEGLLGAADSPNGPTPVATDRTAS